MIRLSDAVHGSPKLQELVRAQADYMELMNKVNKAIQQALLPPTKDELPTSNIELPTPK